MALELVTENFQHYKDYQAVNATILKDILNGGYDVAYTRLKFPQPPTPAFRMGTLAHALILEGREDFVNAQDTNLRTKEGKQWKELQEKKGLEVLKPDQVADLYGMRDSVEHDKHAKAFLDACNHREKSIYANVNGETCKARLDGISVENGEPAMLLDLKTVANIDDFERDFFKYGYDIQADFYRILTGAPALPFVFIAVEKTAPYRVRTFLRDTNELVTSVYLADMLRVAGQVVRDAQANERKFYAVDTDYLNGSAPAWIHELRERHLHESLAGLGLTL